MPIRTLPLFTALVLGLCCAIGPAPVASQSLDAGFVLQAELHQDGQPALGSFDVQAQLFDAAEAGTAISPVLSLFEVEVIDGLLSVRLDFGPAQFAGERQWLELAVGPAGQGSLQPLPARLELQAAPYAWSARHMLSASVSGHAVAPGTVVAGHVDANQVQLRVQHSCPPGQAIRAVGADGSVDCEPVPSEGGTVTEIATGAGLAGGPITSSGSISLAASGIGSAQIRSSEVQRRVSESCPVGEGLRWIQASGAISCTVDDSGPAGWSLNGNGSTNPETEFIGTTDARSMEFRSRGVAVMRLQPSAELSGGQPITANRIAGSTANSVLAGKRGATIAGGGVVQGLDSVFPDRGPNRANGDFDSIGGGIGNSTGVSPFGTVSGGVGNSAPHSMSSVTGGIDNRTVSDGATIGGGQQNEMGAQPLYAAIGGGLSNHAANEYSTIEGGEGNCAGAAYGWVGGVQSKSQPSGQISTGACGGIGHVGSANAKGSFVWSDSVGDPFIVGTPDSFAVRALNGVVILRNTDLGLSNFSSTLRVGGLLRVEQMGAAGGSSQCRNSSRQLGQCASSQRYKQDIQPYVQGLGLVKRLRAVSYRWQGTERLDIGLIAEEVAELDPRLVFHNEQQQVEGVLYDRIDAPLTVAVQELHQGQQQLAERLLRLQDESTELQALIDQLGRSKHHD